MIYLTDSNVIKISVNSLKPSNEKYQPSDNKNFTLSFEDGSLAVIDYFSTGNKDFPKELLEVHFDNKTIVMEDYKKMMGYGIKLDNIHSNISKKRHEQEWSALYNSLRKEENWPISLSDMIQATEISFMINDL